MSYLADEYTWELRDRDMSVGRIFILRHEISGAPGSWRIEASRRRAPVFFRPGSPTNVTGAYYPRRLLHGGRLSLSTGETYMLRVNPLSGVSRLIDSGGNILLRITPHRGSSGSNKTLEVKLSQTSAEGAPTLLASLAACYVLMVVEPPAVGAGG